MTYFIDFDRTLFNTDAFNASLADEPACAPFADQLRAVLCKKRDESIAGGQERLNVWQKVSEVITSGALSYAPGVLEKYLYADVREFMREAANEAIIITYGEVERQRVKIESAFGTMTRITVLYTGFVSKADYLKTWPGYHGGVSVLVDDRVIELAGVVEAFPTIRLFEMRRDGGAGDGRFPVITSLAQLP